MNMGIISKKQQADIRADISQRPPMSLHRGEGTKWFFTKTVLGQ